MDPSFHFQAEIPVAFYCFSTFLTASHQSAHFLLAPLSFEPHLYGAINPHVTEVHCHWRSLLLSQRCLSLTTSLQYFEFTPQSDAQQNDGKHQSEKRGLAFVSGWKGKVATRAVPWWKTPFLILGYLCLGQSLLGQEVERRVQAALTHLTTRGHCKGIVTGEMVRVIKLSVKCTLGTFHGMPGGRKRKASADEEPRPGQVTPSSLHMAW